MGEARRIDRIDTAPRFTAAEAEALNHRFADADTDTLLRAVLTQGVAGRVAVVSSFGAESAVLLHLVARVNPATPVLFLDTGKHFAETLAYRDALVARLGLTGLVNLTPDADLLAKRDENGLRWSFDPDGCCDIRKVQPLARALAGFDATITGRKGFQSATRAGLPRFELDTADAAGRLKVNPLASWRAEDLAAWFAAHDLPAHPLVAEGYPSIGCSPCTSKVQPGEDPRSGRWRGWDKTECGIHAASPVPGTDGKPGDLPPDYEPAF
ncbi:MAG TPA: phosphoadenylyl-sulfate reductase [Novosphingobium sp.]|nr:phosphoadenylyl-sulfate reductase [Novosphingobium sp.]HZV11009.1 phosphoadenylyl-sulfate reductase [Novosphingobium sp.]